MPIANFLQLLYNVILALRDSLSILLKNSTDKRTIIENYDLVALAINEIVDDGIILETDPMVVSSRVSRAPAQDAPNMKNIDLSEQGLLNAWEFGKRKQRGTTCDEPIVTGRLLKRSQGASLLPPPDGNAGVWRRPAYANGRSVARHI